jgi:hypothetical protein
MKSSSGGRDRSASATKIMACHCTHDYQDKRYGKGMRLHNPYAKGYRCTFCGFQKEAA